MIKDYIEQKGLVVTDGAMGTYFYELTNGKDTMAEWANIYQADVIEKIHNQYIKAGAKLIRTNTFSANRKALKVDDAQLESIIKEGYRIAEKAAMNEEVLIAADIGPILEEEESFQELYDQYQFIVDTFINTGAKLFLFETFSSAKYLKEITEYIKNKVNDAVIITQFAIDSTGHTQQGIAAEKLFREVVKIDTIDYYGLNCGVGPTHMHKLVKGLVKKGFSISTVLPNAGYPRLENGRMVYPGNPLYFAGMMKEISTLGPVFLGGCCGTTPEHIRIITKELMSIKHEKVVHDIETHITSQQFAPNENMFMNRLKQGKKTLLVELDPPYSCDLSKVLKGAKVLKDAGVHLITIADSPLGRARVDSITVASIINRQIGIDVMPHVCCRDTNIIGLKSKLLGCHIEGVRQILAVTGDPVPSVDRGEIKGVFNINAVKLMQLITELNEEIFNADPLYYGGALNLNTENIQKQMNRLHKKEDAGASYYLTQPIYSEEAIANLKYLKEKTDFKILAGIMPLVSLRNALYLSNEVPGIDIPERYIDLFNRDITKEEAIATGRQIAIDLAKEVIPYADGLYFIAPFNRATMISDIIKELKEGGLC
ncbi:bifunctional homocysteine S-methyltransferase/methylenetetrahydrofolate reductase [Vallitalea okinawensis]|uniref:bifunctional homocysteine S-methyltransferase/methylenetetrahydrofolate reductase n=1 Tax=Vallitalea okinawensis TaxID=2078660 RepID=UPI000CFAF026|nr:bifunctional homocysteine S-methyltransferase/methylenetetrahydrofolate reductase [Vallitalea okinawensis]